MGFRETSHSVAVVTILYTIYLITTTMCHTHTTHTHTHTTVYSLADKHIKYTKYVIYKSVQDDRITDGKNDYLLH